MGHFFIVGPMNEHANWEIDPHQFTQELQRNWSDVEISPVDSHPDSPMLLHWSIYIRSYPLLGSLHNDKCTISLETGDLEEAASVILWYRSFISPEHELFLYDPYFDPVEIKEGLGRQALIELYHHPYNSEVYAQEDRATLEALGESGLAELVANLATGSIRDGLYYKSVRLLARLSEGVVIPLLEKVLREENQNLLLQHGIIHALVRLGDSGITPLVEILEDLDRSVLHLQVLYAFGNQIELASVQFFEHLKELPIYQRLIKALLRFTSHPNDEFIYMSLQLLSKSNDQRVVASLLEILEKQANSILGQELLTTLGTMGEVQAVEPLIAVLNNKKQDLYTRIRVAVVLGQLGDKRAIDPLINAIIPGDTEFNTNIAAALANFQDERVVETLIGLLYERGSSHTVATSLARQGEKIISRLVKAMLEGEGHDILSYSITRALGLIGEAAIPALSQLITHSDPNIRFWAIGTFGEFHPDLQIPSQLLLTAFQDSDISVRSLAILVVRKSKDERIYEELIKTVRDPEVQIRSSAVIALGRLEDPRALPILQELAEHDEGVDEWGTPIRYRARSSIQQITHAVNQT